MEPTNPLTTASPSNISPGDMLQGKFRVERIVGRGGMGVVIEATNIQLDQKVALKLLATGAEDPTIVERFSNEARAAARLKSEHVARVYDVGRDTLYGPFIVMEMLNGKTLAELLVEAKRIQLHRAVEYVIDACEGLAEAHARGIVHQDVKPANLFLVIGSDGRPSIKLLDFGIATMRSKDVAAGAKDDGKSSGPSVGTPAYLAPEQLRSLPSIDHHVDIWALGCVLFELLTGVRAFKASRFTELITSILEASHTPFPEDLEIPFEVAEAIDRCLEKDPAKRYKSTGELALVLLPFARRRAHASVARAVAHVKAAGLDPTLEMPSSMPPRPSDGAIDLVSSTALKAPNVPTFSSGPPQHQASDAPFQATPLPLPGPTTRSENNRGLGIALLALLVVVLGVGGVIGMHVLDRHRASTTTSSSPSSTPTIPPSAMASITTTASGEASVTPDPPPPPLLPRLEGVTASSSPSSPSTIAGGGLHGRGTWRRPTSGSGSAPVFVPAQPNDSEIRHTR